MVNNQYAQGRRAEYRVRDYFIKEGYFAWRTAGSHGPFDVIAINEYEVVLAQVKSYTDRCVDYSADEEKLRKVPAPSCVKKLLVTVKVGEGIEDIRVLK